MAPSQSELPIDHQPLYGKILEECYMLGQIGKNPYEFEDDALDSEEIYRSIILNKRTYGLPVFNHIKPPQKLTQLMQTKVQRYNVIATLANIASDMFLMGDLKYEEYCSLARACVQDTIIDIVVEDESRQLAALLNAQDTNGTAFYTLFSKAVDAALAGDYTFTIPDFDGCSPEQTNAIGKVQNQVGNIFLHHRAAFNKWKWKGVVDTVRRYANPSSANIEANMATYILEDHHMLAQHGITPEMSTFVGQFTLDESLAVSV